MKLETAKIIAKTLHTVKKLQEKFEKESNLFRSQGNFKLSEERNNYAVGALASYSEILQSYFPDDCFKILEELKKIEGKENV